MLNPNQYRGHHSHRGAIVGHNWGRWVRFHARSRRDSIAPLAREICLGAVTTIPPNSTMPRKGGRCPQMGMEC